MTPAATSTPVAPPADPVGAALADAATHNGLLTHALALVGRWRAHRSAADRRDAAEEAVQETAQRALAGRGGYDPARGSATGWLHGILNNVLRQCARSLQRQPAQPPADPAAWDRLTIDLTPPPGADRLDAAALLARLPDDHRSVLELRFLHGLDHAAIAARLGISVGNARVRLSRALTATKALVEEDGR